MSKTNNPWIDKYRPKKIKDIIQQEEIVKTLENTKKSGQLPHLLLYGPPGTGKCLGENVEVLLYDGSTKKAKYITKKDILVGDNGSERFVIGTTTGKDHMYKVVQEYGDDYIVNSIHVLSLILIIDYVIEIIDDTYYLYWFENHELKKESFEEKIYVDIKIYSIKNIRNNKYDICDISLDKYLVKPAMWKRFYKGFKANLKIKDNLINKYFVDNKYKTNNELVANTLIKKSRYFGYIVDIKMTDGFYNLTLINWKPYNIYVEYIGIEKYYGFELSGNGRFLLKDFTVTHNTSTILALCNELFGSKIKERVLELNASDSGGIDIVRNKIIPFSKFYVNDENIPPYKIIILDEADAMTVEAQSALRKVMEEESGTTRFCLICNYLNQIIKPIISRCSKFRFKPISIENMTTKIKNIAEKEDIDIDEKSIEKISELSKGDIRKGIMSLQNLKYYKNYKKIEINDIYDITGTINPTVVNELWKILVSKNNIDDITKQVENIINSGYNILSLYDHLNNKIINSGFDDKEKSLLLIYLSSSENKLNDGADEYIQLMAVFSFISRINKKYVIGNDHLICL